MGTEEKLVDHVVTEVDLELNPEWKDQDIKVGDTIQIPEADHLELSSLEDSVPEQEEEKPAEKKEGVNVTVVPRWARLENEDHTVPVENTLVYPEKKKEAVDKENLPEWANA